MDIANRIGTKAINTKAWVALGNEKIAVYDNEKVKPGTYVAFANLSSENERAH